jgi:hypothetical protein
VVDRLLSEVRDASLLESFVEGSNVIGVEDEAAQRALRDQLTELLSGGFVVQGRTWLLEVDLDVGLARDADGQPALGPLFDVRADLKPELVDVEVERLLLVEDINRGDVELGEHRSFLLCACRCGRRSG